MTMTSLLVILTPVARWPPGPPLVFITFSNWDKDFIAWGVMTERKIKFFCNKLQQFSAPFVSRMSNASSTIKSPYPSRIVEAYFVDGILLRVGSQHMSKVFDLKSL